MFSSKLGDENEKMKIDMHQLSNAISEKFKESIK